jgi:hypothetical protein
MKYMPYCKVNSSDNPPFLIPQVELKKRACALVDTLIPTDKML